MSKLKVLVVDDSSLYRKALIEALKGEPQVEVVGEAWDGARALELIPSLHPNVITLDLEMPQMDGLATLRAIRSKGWDANVLMVSAFGGEGRTVEALCLGAQDFILKPSRGQESGLTRLREVLLPKILQFCRSTPPRPAAVVHSRATPSVFTPPRSATTPVSAVVIGVSTGGPNALGEVIPLLPADLPVPVLVVQHMPPTFTTMLASRLDERSKVRVKEAVQGERVRPSTVYLAPGDYHMEVHDNQIHLQQGPPEHSCRPAADVLFRSAAARYGKGCLGVVLTGMGRDGVEGARAIRTAGGHTLVQNQASCVVWGMPKLVCEAGLADAVLDIHAISEEIVRRVCGKKVAR